MRHFAKVFHGKVIEVIVAEPEFFDTFVDSSPGDWIETGTNMRGNFAGVGYTYDYDNDVFYPSKPYQLWTISAPDWKWTSPKEHPSDDKRYEWSDAQNDWIEI
jgi:hypothetical protein